MNKGDVLVDRGADRLQELADRAAARGDGVGEWLSEELRNDAAFLRKLKPSLVKARAKGDAPTNQEPPPAPSGPQLGSRPKSKKKRKAQGRQGPGAAAHRRRSARRRDRARQGRRLERPCTPKRLSTRRPASARP